MTISYHLYTIMFSGFNPINYMMKWYLITIGTPILGFICWYAKGNNIISLIISIGVLTAMMLCCFVIGMWYFDFIEIKDTLLFLGTMAVFIYKLQK